MRGRGGGKGKRRRGEPNLVPLNLGLGVVLKLAVALDAALDELAELAGKDLGVVQVVDAEARARGLGRIARSDPPPGRADPARRRRNEEGVCVTESAVNLC